MVILVCKRHVKSICSGCLCWFLHQHESIRKSYHSETFKVQSTLTVSAFYIVSDWCAKTIRSENVPLSFRPFSSMVICSASSDSDSSMVWLPRSVWERRRLKRFIFSMELSGRGGLWTREQLTCDTLLWPWADKDKNRQFALVFRRILPRLFVKCSAGEVLDISRIQFNAAMHFCVVFLSFARQLDRWDFKSEIVGVHYCQPPIPNISFWS